MGLLDFIFGKDPEWVEVSKDTSSTQDPMSKGDSKKLLKFYLEKLRFNKEDIRDEVELYTEGMQDPVMNFTNNHSTPKTSQSSSSLI